MGSDLYMNPPQDDDWRKRASDLERAERERDANAQEARMNAAEAREQYDRAEAAEAERDEARADRDRQAQWATRWREDLEAAEAERDDALVRVSLLVGHLDRSDEKSAALLARAEAAEAERDEAREQYRLACEANNLIRDAARERYRLACEANNRIGTQRDEAEARCARVAEEKVAEIVAALRNRTPGTLSDLAVAAWIERKFGSVAGDANECGHCRRTVNVGMHCPEDACPFPRTVVGQVDDDRPAGDANEKERAKGLPEYGWDLDNPPTFERRPRPD